jgi:hypothetical protein
MPRLCPYIKRPAMSLQYIVKLAKTTFQNKLRDRPISAKMAELRFKKAVSGFHVNLISHLSGLPRPSIVL